MAVSAYQVRVKAQAYVDALTNLSAKEREHQPLAPYAEDFNGLLALAREVAPDVDARLWPRPIEISHNDVSRTVRARYAEIHTYALQVLNLLPDAPLGIG